VTPVDLNWAIATEAGAGHPDGTNQDAYWSSPGGRMCAVADGGTREGQHAEVASGIAVATAARLYRPDAGDDLIARIVKEANTELLLRVARDEPIGVTTLALFHVLESGRVLASILGDSAVMLVRQGHVATNVRPLRKYDYYAREAAQREEADYRFDELPWWMRGSLLSALPWASQGIVPTIVDLRPATGDTIVVCTDGVSDALSEDELGHIAARGSLQDATAALIAAARVRDPRDDRTCAVARWP